MEKIRGVNLGNWLVLEKWITEELFVDSGGAMDETYLCKNLGKERVIERLKVHPDEFITERDFEDMAFKGFNAVRIPVPFYLFEDVGPYVHCYEYLDNAFNWAERYRLKILVDLHSAPGGHNGTDNSGICGIRTGRPSRNMWITPSKSWNRSPSDTAAARPCGASAFSMSPCAATRPRAS